MRTLKNKNGWITVACSFVLQALSHGLGSSMGVFYIQWEQTFPSSSALISALATSVLATILCTAPISGAISRKVGIRIAMVLGGALSFAGFVCTSFVYSASLLFLTVAVMIGFGSSVVYMAAVVAVSNHFTKNFATASAVANAGASAGVLILPILFEILVSTYDWRGACLVVSAIQLHVFVCLMIIKSPRKPSKPSSTSVTRRAEDRELDGARVRTDAGTPTTTEEEHKSTNGKCGGDSGARHRSGRGRESKSTDGIVTSIDMSINGIDGRKCAGDEDVRNGGNEIRIETENGEGHLTMRNRMDHNDSQDDEISSKKVNSDEFAQVTLTSQGVGDPSSQEITQTPNEANHSNQSQLEIGFSCFTYIVDLFNIRLLWTDPPFTTLMLSFSLGGWFLGTILPHLAARALSAGISKLLASSLISVIGAGNLISRCIYGQLVDSGIIHPVHLLFLAYATTALSSAIVAFSTVYSLLCIGALGIGIGVGIYIPLMQPLVRSLVGPKGFSGGFGLYLLSVGIGNFMSATFAGLIYDFTQNYTYVFLLPTSVGALASFTVLVNQLVWGKWRKCPRWPTKAKRKAERTASPDESDGVTLDLDSLNTSA